jgi:hypothetical protein
MKTEKRTDGDGGKPQDSGRGPRGFGSSVGVEKRADFPGSLRARARAVLKLQCPRRLDKAGCHAAACDRGLRQNAARGGGNSGSTPARTRPQRNDCRGNSLSREILAYPSIPTTITAELGASEGAVDDRAIGGWRVSHRCRRSDANREIGFHARPFQGSRIHHRTDVRGRGYHGERSRLTRPDWRLAG